MASFVKFVGQEGADGGLPWFVLVVRITEHFAAFASPRIHGGFPARLFVQIGDAGVVVCLQPAVMVEVCVLFEHFLADSLQHIVEAHPRRDGLQTDHLAALLTFVESPNSRLLAIS